MRKNKITFSNIKNGFKKYIVQILMAILLITLTIVLKQRFIKLLPCLVSLFVYYLDSKVNRFAKLLGASNCIVYSIGYFIDGLYGSVASALLYSMPLQIFTFLLWSKNKYKQGTKLRLLNTDLRLVSIALIFIVANIYLLILGNAKGSSYTIIQSYQFSAGLIATILIMFGCIEGMVINLISTALSFYVYFDFMLKGQINQLTYFVMNIYTVTFLVIGLVNWIKMYKEQHSNVAINGQN